MQDINRYLDAAILVPEFTTEQREEALKTCIDLKVFSVCVQPCDIPRALEVCEGTETAVCVVLGFPSGNQLTASKADEAKRYLDLGVDEIDMVANYGRAKSGAWDEVQADIAAVAEQTQAAGKILKVIFETAHLDAAQVEKLVEVSIAAGADFVKTSTGFNGEGAKEEDVALMVKTAAGRARVKPSGGIRNYERARGLVEMGADRLGVNWTACGAICAGEDAGGTGY